MAYERVLWLPDVLRAAGLSVVEHRGWRLRGLGSYRPFVAKAVVWHHDASAPGDSPSVPAAMIARFDTAAAQCWVARDGTWHVIASGRAPHAGATLPGKPSNETSLGVETDHTTGEAWPPALLHSLRRGTAAILRHIGTDPAAGLHFHKTICDPPGRKVDPAGLDLVEERGRVAQEMVSFERHERVGTMNEKTTVDAGQAASDLAYVSEHADILGLQEWGPNRQRILNSHHGWTWTKPGAACPPVGARTHRYTLLSSHKHLLARGRRVEPVPGRKTVLPDCNATAAFWTERKTGDSVAVINWHAPAHVEAVGLYRRLRDQLTGRARMHRTARRHLRRYADRLVKQGIDRVYIVGDTNYHLMRLRGWVSCWDGHHPKATHGSRTIDIIYARQRSDAARTYRTASDHHAVIATYTLEG